MHMLLLILISYVMLCDFSPIVDRDQESDKSGVSDDVSVLLSSTSTNSYDTTVATSTAVDLYAITTMNHSVKISILEIILIIWVGSLFLEKLHRVIHS